MIANNYLEKTYAGFIGMNVGIRLGAPVEPTAWTSERIERFYGDTTGYIKDFKNFAADDDSNGPVFFLRALYDDAKDRELTPQDVAKAWLNYAREGMGMFWWGGYGVSTEHTAYLNLKAGIPAPQSGSAATNGLIMAEQIGGQIFVDTWGLVYPGNSKKAAEYASMAASVSHDGNGIYGGAFIAACIAAAYNTSDVDELLDAGLEQIPQDCTYAEVVNAVRQFHRKSPDDWHACLAYLQQNWGYDKYTGVCHIIPNAGVCVLAMLYGKSFARTVEIATMCGWDTDCNAGNVGTIMGVACGLEGIPEHYRKPINDGIVLSGISGYLNILDIPTYAKELVLLGYRLAGEPVPAHLESSMKQGEIHFDFELPGSTHNLRLSSNTCSLRHSTLRAYSGTGSAEILFDRMSRGQKCKIYYKPFYRRDDFDDERYMPVFSPTAYPGQTVSMTVYAERYSGESIILNPYVRNTFTKQDILLSGMVIKEEGWQHISFTIPQLDGAMVDEIGLLFEANSPAKNKDFGCLYIDDFTITGKSNYTIDILKQKKELASITPFSHNHGAWEIENGIMQAMCLEHAEAMTGNYYMRDVRITGKITPYTGESHLISARVQGAIRGYYGGFAKGGVAIFCNNSGMKQLATCPFEWQYNKEYTVELLVTGSHITLSVDGKQLLQAEDSTHTYGMAGYAMYALGRSGFGNLAIEEL
ncbi:ADP-ribosylglycohydrolase family protein [Oscillospiraceae bacterium PP1C4]